MTDTTHEIEGLYPIRTVAEITGINPVTLRAWERRYGLIKPQRTPKGHRLYTDEHIDEIRRVMALVDRGVSIGQVKRIMDSKEIKTETRAPTATADDHWETYRQRMLHAVSRFDETALDAVYNDSLSLYPVDLVTRCVILPLLSEMRERSGERAAGDVEARFLQTYLRNKLGARFHHQSSQSRGPRLLAACLPGESSDVELLLFGLAAMGHGFRMVLLGANTSLEPLPLALERSGCRGLVLFGHQEPPGALLRTHLPNLAKQITVSVFVGGQVANDHARALKQAGLIPLVGDAQGALRQIEEELGARSTE